MTTTHEDMVAAIGCRGDVAVGAVIYVPYVELTLNLPPRLWQALTLIRSVMKSLHEPEFFFASLRILCPAAR